MVFQIPSLRGMGSHFTAFDHGEAFAPQHLTTDIYTYYWYVEQINPPCNTLFVGNLGEEVIKEELRNLFSTQGGFKQMKVLKQERNTVCFIEHEDVESARNVHQNLQGAVVPSSGRGGMRIQYSKNPFGRRNDGFNLGGVNETLN